MHTLTCNTTLKVHELTSTCCSDRRSISKCNALWNSDTMFDPSVHKPSPHLLSDGPSLEKGTQRERESRDAVVKSVKKRYFIDLDLPTALAS